MFLIHVWTSLQSSLAQLRKASSVQIQSLEEQLGLRGNEKRVEVSPSLQHSELPYNSRPAAYYTEWLSPSVIKMIEFSSSSASSQTGSITEGVRLSFFTLFSCNGGCLFENCGGLLPLLPSPPPGGSISILLQPLNGVHHELLKSEIHSYIASLVPSTAGLDYIQ